MVDTLRRLVNMASFNVLQDKMDNWLDDYTVNTCDQNVDRCLEIIELNSRLQAQLVRLLSLTAAEGGVYGGAAAIKTRLLPLLGNLYVAGSRVDDAALSALSEAAAKDRELQQVQDVYETSLKALEEDLSLTKAEADQLKIELEVKNDQLARERRKSTSEKIFTDTELIELRTKLRQLEDELVTSRGSSADVYQRQINRLKDEIALLNARRNLFLTSDSVNGGDVAVTSSPRQLLTSSTFVIDESPSERYQQQKLITRFNEMFSRDRLEAMNTLRQCQNGDHENSQRIVFSAVQESFAVTRRAFAEYKMKVRSALAVTYTGQGTLDEAVQDYIERHNELFETTELVADVVRALNRQTDLYLAPGLTFMIIHPLIRESCRLAWSMFALKRPLDVAPAARLELFDDMKYRRSYDSDISAPLVTHHIWPCLMQGSRVLMKGEAYAVRGGSASLSRRSRSPLRSSGSLRTSRSPSPLRTTDRGRSPLRTTGTSTSLSRYVDRT
jgi:hypothetical protein